MLYPRVRHFDSGMAMVVTDLHGEGDAFDQVIHTFFDLLEAGQADRLIICGDLIHIRRPVEDHSLRMVKEIIKWQEKLGEDTILMLMGNHEMPHIYNITLAKGHEEYTAPFEHALTQSGDRDIVHKFFRSLPLYITTEAGVLISHAGATAAVTKDYEAQNILTFDHDALIQLADDRILNNLDIEVLKHDREYVQQAIEYTAITGLDDPRFHHLLRGQVLSHDEEEFQFLWDVLFARNEQQWGNDTYQVIAQHFLRAIADATGQNLNVILAGHISTRGAYHIVCDEHLRLSSFAHAHPHESGQYLLLDCAELVNQASDLVPHLRPLFP
ncbi:MAG: metallophosphoesterase [Chloroflexota bacterium]